MDLSNIDNVLFMTSLAGQALLMIVLVRNKIYKEFPIFVLYSFFAMASDPVVILWMYHLHVPSASWGSNPNYYRVFYAVTIPEYLLGFGVLLEIGKEVLAPKKRSLPSGSVWLLAALMAAGALVVYLFVGHASSATLLTRLGSALVTVGLTNAILRIVCFTIIAVFAQLLGVNWRNHVLQLATGLAFYGAVDLIVRLAHAHLASGGNVAVYYAQFRLLDEIRVLGYLSSLTFWCWSFAKKEAPRKEFSPQMAGFLVSMAGAAKRDRSQFGR